MPPCCEAQAAFPWIDPICTTCGNCFGDHLAHHPHRIPPLADFIIVPYHILLPCPQFSILTPSEAIAELLEIVASR